MFFAIWYGLILNIRNYVISFFFAMKLLRSSLHLDQYISKGIVPKKKNKKKLAKTEILIYFVAACILSEAIFSFQLQQFSFRINSKRENKRVDKFAIHQI